MSPSPASSFFPKGFDGFAQQVLHFWMSNALIAGFLEELDGTISRKQLVKDIVEEHARHANPNQNHRSISGSFGVFLG
jgi:hypothetical protein